jgi:integrase
VSKRGHLEGTWAKRGDRWRYRFRANGRRLSVTAATKREAKRLAQEAAEGEARRQSAQLPAARYSDSLGAWVRTWLDDVLPTTARRDATMKQYRSLMVNHVLGSPLADQPLRKVTALDLEQLIASRDLAVSSRRSLHAALAACLYDAERANLVATSPMTKARRPSRRGGEVADREHVPSTDEVVALLAQVKGSYLEPMVQVMIGLGLRRGEVLGLQWRDIDLDTMTVNICRQLTASGVSAPKSQAGVRTVPLPDGLRDILVKHHQDETERLQLVDDPAPEFVFTGTTGRPMQPRRFSLIYQAAARQAMLVDTGAHALRRYYASRLMSEGVSVVDVARWLGHSDGGSLLLAKYAASMGENLGRGQRQVSDVFTGVV